MPAPPGGNRGSFKEGHPGMGGRPPRTAERRYLQVLTEEVTDEDWREVVRAALADAKVGDARARLWLSKYVLGDDPLEVLERIDQLEDALREAQEARDAYRD